MNLENTTKFRLRTFAWCAGSFDATVRIWDCKSQSTKPIQILEESGDSVSSLDVLGHEIVTGSVDGTVRLYDLRMGKIYADVIGRKSSPPPLRKRASTSPCPRDQQTPPSLLFILLHIPNPPFTFKPPTTAYLPPSPLPPSTEAITSVQQTRDSHAVLVSTLDSTIRLMDKANGQRLQSYKGHMNNDYRIRSTLAFADSVVISGSEDGQIYAWDLLSGDVVERLHPWSGDDDAREGEGESGGKEKDKRKVASAVACSPAQRQWASAGVNGEFSLLFLFFFLLRGATSFFFLSFHLSSHSIRPSRGP